jgi:hypothetical protein
MQRHGLVGDEVEPMRAIGAPDLLRKDVLDVGTVERSRDEGQAIGRRIDGAPLLFRPVSDPIKETIPAERRYRIQCKPSVPKAPFSPSRRNIRSLAPGMGLLQAQWRSLGLLGLPERQDHRG